MPKEFPKKIPKEFLLHFAKAISQINSQKKNPEKDFEEISSQNHVAFSSTNSQGIAELLVENI